MAAEMTHPMISKFYLADEAQLMSTLVEQVGLDATARTAIEHKAKMFADAARSRSRRAKLIDQFLQEYGLSTHEGVTLMRLCEALIRTPDAATSNALVRDKVSDGVWSEHVFDSPSLLVNLSTIGLQLSSGWISATGGIDARNLAAKMGDGVLRQAMQRAMAMMGDHFVLGATIEHAQRKARSGENAGYVYSYDMLGEAAHTEADAARYFAAYEHAIQSLAKASSAHTSIAEAPGISVKLSALHPRYEYNQRDVCVPALAQRITALSSIAKSAGIGLTLDAEEADRLEVSLDIFQQLLNTPALAGWDGLGIVIQAYQRRASAVIDEIVRMARAASRKITVRLVKGAYWDMEIKRAQELGLESYPVFTRKENTDVSYLACARKLFAVGDVIFPQFATHNAHTVASVMHMAGQRRDYEFQRLHGMGEALHESLVETAGVRSRIYAPVGQHKDLLPYLVRRLLENGANSSFVNQLLDPAVDTKDIVRDPVTMSQFNDCAQHEKIPDPQDLFGGKRLSARGIDLTQSIHAHRVEAFRQQEIQTDAASLIAGERISGAIVPVTSPNDGSPLGTAAYATSEHVVMATASAQASSWSTQFSASQRAACLRRAADLLEDQMDVFIHLCMEEAGKTYPDGVAEVREAVDFCRYYADQAETAEINGRAPLGVVACISPWNFPLAIFLGQITAALAVGNTVVAKPAEQTPIVAYEALQLLHDAGIPQDAVHLIIGDGASLGTALVSDPTVKGVCFTGSTRTAKRIALNLAETGRPQTPLIAETGGLNAMIIDSTALLEQAVTDVIASAFQSAGQRCSACRVVCVQEDVADAFIEMLTGAMDLLHVGHPQTLKTDVGPVIDRAAGSMLETYITEKRTSWRVRGETPLPEDLPRGHYVRPVAFEINAISELEHEVFGPVLHVVRFKAAQLDQLIDDINHLGYGLTLGLHTRIDARIQHVAERARVGNLYVNRNQIGAVVGVQPFGGEGLSGTGPKAGGPHYLKRLTRPEGEMFSSGAAPDIPALEKHHDAGSNIAKVRKAFEAQKRIDRAAIFAQAAKAAEAHSMADAATLTRLTRLIDEVYNRTRTLPGPTGEANTLRLAPRGVLLCMGNDDPATAMDQLLQTLASGNAAIMAYKDDQLDVLEVGLDALRRAGLPDGLVCFVPGVESGAYLSTDIDGVVCDETVQTFIADTLCRRDGAILPLLSIWDDPERFCVERTLTINTTAAGGNASLLAM